MAEQVQKKAEYSNQYRYNQDDHERQEYEDWKTQEAQRKAGKLAVVSEIDDILDEIDKVLETNTEEFVSRYIQAGGQ